MTIRWSPRGKERSVTGIACKEKPDPFLTQGQLGHHSLGMHALGKHAMEAESADFDDADGGCEGQ